MKKRILILDDNQAILDVVAEALAYENFEVLAILLGSQLPSAVETFKPHLVLLDYRLADAKGSDLCSWLKSSPQHRHIPVVIFSAYVNPGEALPVPCDSYLYKPFNLSELLTVVHQLLPAAKEFAP